MDAFPKRFQGRSAIVTGGADGIGAAIAERLINEGAHVTLLDQDARRTREAVERHSRKGFEVDSFTLDVGGETAVEEAFTAVGEKRGKIDAVVHAAGIVGPNATKALEVRVEDFDEVYRVNLRGSFLVARAAIRQMEPQGYGRIVLFASIAGKEGNAACRPIPCPRPESLA